MSFYLLSATYFYINLCYFLCYFLYLFSKKFKNKNRGDSDEQFFATIARLSSYF